MLRSGNAVPTLVGLGVIALMAACAPRAAAPSAAPAPAASAADSGASNPLIGNWTLVSADDAATCAESLQFTNDTYTTVWKGVTQSNHATYRAYPGYVNVVSGNDLAHYQQYNLTGTDTITNVTGNQYAINNCPYKRA